jgi:hypothetical protein
LGLNLDFSNPYLLTFGEDTASVMFCSVDQSERYRFPRAVGRIRPLVEGKSVGKGIRHGIIASADSFWFWRGEIGFHLKNLFENEFDGVHAIEKYSVVSGSDVRDVCHEIDELMTKALRCEDLFVLPWI